MSIVQNKKAFHDYFIEEKYEAGLALEGWEVKAIRAGRAQLKEAYVDFTGYLAGAAVALFDGDMATAVTLLEQAQQQGYVLTDLLADASGSDLLDRKSG